MHRKLVLTLAVLCCLASVAQAQITVTIGDGTHNLPDQVSLQPSAVDGDGPIVPSSGPGSPIQLQPNMPNQAIQIFVSSANIGVSGFVLEAQIADGGPNEGFNTPGVINGPTITADVLTGTIFASNHNPVTQPGGGSEGPMTAFYSVTTQNGTVPSNGLLATLFVDTTGFGPGSGPWELDIGGHQGLYDNDAGPIGNNLPTGSSSLPGTSASITWLNSSLIIPVPEPSSIVLGLFAAAGLGFVAIRRKARRSA